MSRAALFVLALTLCPSLAAQQPAPPREHMMHEPMPAVVTSAVGEAQVTPDRATIAIGVQTRAKTAEEAGAENAQRQRAVIDTLRALGIPANQIATVSYNVYPEQVYHPDQGDQAPRIVGYNVSNTVRVEVRQLDKLGSVIDAALAKGANGINSLDLSASNIDEARRSALAAALARARGDAEALARAAGGQLGALVEASTEEAATPRTFKATTFMNARAEAAPTPISPGEQTLRVTVTARWRFVPGSGR
jgi:uncharacterized protein YggE